MTIIMKPPLNLADCLDLELIVMKKIGCSDEELLRTSVKRYNELQTMKLTFFGLFKRKFLDADELVKIVNKNKENGKK